MNVPLPAGKAKGEALRGIERKEGAVRRRYRSNPALSVNREGAGLSRRKPGEYRAFSNNLRYGTGQILSTGGREVRSRILPAPYRKRRGREPSLVTFFSNIPSNCRLLPERSIAIHYITFIIII